MASTTWLEIVDANVRERGELVIGIDPSLADLPQFFERGDGHWISRHLRPNHRRLRGHCWH